MAYCLIAQSHCLKKAIAWGPLAFRWGQFTETVLSVLDITQYKVLENYLFENTVHLPGAKELRQYICNNSIAKQSQPTNGPH